MSFELRLLKHQYDAFPRSITMRLGDAGKKLTGLLITYY